MDGREKDLIQEACFDLARTIRWARKPIDAEEIDALAKQYAGVAMGMLSPSSEIDPSLIARAIRYLDHVHGMPMAGDVAWFEHTLGTLIEVARPNTVLNGASKPFLLDMLEGITKAQVE
jgi:hypothetical protein